MDSENAIRIICPFCGNRLKVPNIPGIESKSLTCPVCNQKALFSNYRKAEVPAVSVADEPHTSIVDERPTENAPGYLTEVATGISLRLNAGRNTIGRRAASSGATIQVSSARNRTSRVHLVIEVVSHPARGFLHYISLYKPEVNATYVGRALLQWGDKLVLRDGDVIKLPDCELVFHS